jgi:hypothetical protein
LRLQWVSVLAAFGIVLQADAAARDIPCIAPVTRQQVFRYISIFLPPDCRLPYVRYFPGVQYPH